MKHFWIAACLTVILGLTTACSPSGAARSDRRGLSESATIIGSQVAWTPTGPLLTDGQRTGDLMVWLSSSPSAPSQGTAKLETFVTNDKGAPVTGATVAYDIDMTNMSHGTYMVPAQPSDDGRYVGQVHFSMPGPWRAIVTIERPDQPEVRLRFEFRVTS